MMPSTNKIRMCAAGSGKTWGICSDALSAVAGQSKRVLITTYTNKGVDTVNAEIEKQNHGIGSNRIAVRSWFQFLISEMIRPYQSYITDINMIKSFDFSNTFGKVNYGKVGTVGRYISGSAYVKKDYASELAIYLNQASNGLVIRRVAEVYSHIYIDEFQDMVGCDIEIIKLLFASRMNVTCVGDNKQATYTTHNTKKNKGQSGKNLWDFCAESQKKGLAVIEESMESRRFNRNICAFANRIYPNTKNITTCMAEITQHDGVFLIERSSASQYRKHFLPVVLKYDKKTDVGEIVSFNFGQCKGMTFERVLIYSNGPFMDFLKGKPLSSPEKYYVAATRPRYSLALVVDKFPKTTEFKSVQIMLGNDCIQALKFIVE